MSWDLDFLKESEKLEDIYAMIFFQTIWQINLTVKLLELITHVKMYLSENEQH